MLHGKYENGLRHGILLRKKGLYVRLRVLHKRRMPLQRNQNLPRLFLLQKIKFPATHRGASFEVRST
ncbi:MAG: hypothetical protein PHH75_01440 [Candidatus Omnitrophica bacterium]|nr:hypothetical protein [Candidatus Omnitrophota bacterium]